MRIHFNPKDFSPKFRLAASVAYSRDTEPVLQHVKITANKSEGIILQATDLQSGIRIRADCEVTQNGTAILPKERLLKILDVTREAAFSLEFIEGKIVINGAVEHYELETMPVDEFHNLYGFSASAYHEVPVKVLQTIIRRTIFATDAANVKYALDGVHFEIDGQIISAVSTDGHRLAWQDCTGICVNNHKVESAIVSAPALQLLNKALGDKSIAEHDSVKLAVSGDKVSFQCKDITFISLLTEGRFPEWRNIIPDEKEKRILVKLDKEPLLSAILQAQVMISENDPGMNFSFEKGKLTLQGQDKERGNTKIEIPFSYDDTPFKIKIDPKFMIDFLRVLESKQKISLYPPAEQEGIIKFTADNDEYVYVVMPMST